MVEEIPKIIKDVGFNFSYDKKKVWELNAPVIIMDIKKLEWHFEIPFLRDEQGNKSIKPIDILEENIQNLKQSKRINNANLRYPIDIMKNKGRWLILDGLHRLMKARILKKKTVHVRIVSRNNISKILRQEKQNGF